MKRASFYSTGHFILFHNNPVRICIWLTTKTMADNLVLIIETKQITVIQDSRSISDEKNVDDVKECGKTRVRWALLAQ